MFVDWKLLPDSGWGKAAHLVPWALQNLESGQPLPAILLWVSV